MLVADPNDRWLVNTSEKKYETAITDNHRVRRYKTVKIPKSVISVTNLCFKVNLTKWHQLGLHENVIRLLYICKTPIRSHHRPIGMIYSRVVSKGLFNIIRRRRLRQVKGGEIVPTGWKMNHHLVSLRFVWLLISFQIKNIKKIIFQNKTQISVLLSFSFSPTWFHIHHSTGQWARRECLTKKTNRK